jgi:hypothetical protein
LLKSTTRRLFTTQNKRRLNPMPVIERPQVAQPLRYKSGLIVQTLRGPVKGDLYLIPGLETLDLVAVKPGGSKAKRNKHGWQVYELATGTLVDASRYPESRVAPEGEPLLDIFARIRRTITSNGGVPAFQERIQFLLNQKKPCPASQINSDFRQINVDK